MIPHRPLLLLPALCAALGVGLLALAAGPSLVAVVNGWTRRRLWQATRAAHRRSTTPPTAEALFGIPSLLPWMLLGTLVGGWMSSVLFLGPARYAGALAGTLPLLWKRARIAAGRQQIRREVFDLVESLRLYLACAPTPGSALLLALEEAPEGLLWERLRRQRDTLLIEGPEAGLRQVARELQSPELQRFLARIRAAQAGSGGFATALRAAADELSAELNRELEELVEAAPTRLILPILILLFPTLLMVVLSPPVQAFLDALVGVGPTPLPGG